MLEITKGTWRDAMRRGTWWTRMLITLSGNKLREKTPLDERKPFILVQKDNHVDEEALKECGYVVVRCDKVDKESVNEGGW